MSTEGQRRRRAAAVRAAAVAAAPLLLAAASGGAATAGAPSATAGASVRRAAAFDVSPPLTDLHAADGELEADCERQAGDCGASPAGTRVVEAQAIAAADGSGLVAEGAAVEQTSQGPRPPAALVASFDGQGYGMQGPHGAGGGRNPSDNSMAVGPDHIVEIVNARIAVYSKAGARFGATGEVLFGPIGTNVLFAGFGGPCETRPNGDAVVRYDQLADRWLYVMPLFRRAPDGPDGTPGTFGMCYALSVGPNPLGPYYRYAFDRELFPDYPRPAVWPDGYYVPTSTGDNVIEKHACVVDRTRMLRGQPATEQCVILPDVNFLNNADVDGPGLPPDGAPNVMMATGGAQLKDDFDDDGIYAWKFHVDWDDPRRTEVVGPRKIAVAPYHYLCDGQLTSCVPQPGTDTRLDSQGDKIMQRLVYRKVNGHESILAVHSVATAAGAGGVRWYEFRLDRRRDPVLYQQGTYAPDGSYRWMASPGMDRQGNIGIGYSFGGAPEYAGQRFAARLDGDPLGELTLHETVLAYGQGAQTDTLRWQDYTQLSMDPSDDCTFWYVGDYLKAGAPSYTTRIGAFRLPGCLRATVAGTAFFDTDHDGTRDANEPGLADWPVSYRGKRRPGDQRTVPSDELTTDADGRFTALLSADPAYNEPTYTLSAAPPGDGAWERTGGGIAYVGGIPVPMADGTYEIRVRDRDTVARVDFGNVCVVHDTSGSPTQYWLSDAGREALRAADEPVPEDARTRRRRRSFFGPGVPGGWRVLVNVTARLAAADGSRFAVDDDGDFEDAYKQLAAWLRGDSGANRAYALSVQLATTALNVAYGGQVPEATVRDPVDGDWVSIVGLLGRVDELLRALLDAPATTAGADAAVYTTLLESLNAGTATVTPPDPLTCPSPRPR